jgi:hypothetical protein
MQRINKAINEGKIKAPENGADFPVLMGLQIEEGFPHQGTFDFINNVFNPSTGSIAVRGLFANPRRAKGTRLLRPGMFVRIRLPIGEPHKALLVIDKALGSDQGLKFVYVLDKDNKAAVKLRLRPILMTSFAFILGVVPLVVAKGAGAEMRRSLGVAVFAGMLGVTLFGIFLTPVFYYVIQWFGANKKAALEPISTPSLSDGERTEEPHRPELTIAALEKLVQSGTPQAYALLEALAHGSGGEALTKEAKASLQRLTGIKAKI